MTKNPFLLFIVIFILNSDTINCQLTNALTIEQAISIGLENSKSLHASFMKVRYADAKVREANSLLLPTLKASGSYTRLSDVPPFRATIPTGAFGNVQTLGPLPPEERSFSISPTVLNNYNFRFTLQQPLFTGFRLQNNSKLAEYTARSTEQDYQKDKAELIYNINFAFWNLFKAIEFEKVINENVVQVEAHLKDVQNFFKQGLVTKNEVLKVEVQLSNIQVLQIDARNNVRLAMINLNSLIGLPLETKIELNSVLDIQTKVYDDINILVQKAIGSRSEINAMEMRVKAGETGVSITQAGWYPQIFLTGNYNYARPNQRILPTLDKFKDTWDVSISASFDIWNWGSTIHQTDQAKTLLIQAQDGLEQLKDGVTLEVTQSFLNFNQSKERISVAEKGVAQADENYRITSEKFKSGLVLNSDLLDAEASLLQAKFNYIQSLIDLKLADARLQKAIGIKEKQ